MTATSTAETSTSMSSEPRSSARLRDGVEVMSVTTPWSRRARAVAEAECAHVDVLPSTPAPGWTDGLPANEDGPAQRDLAAAAVDGLAGDEHGDPRGALEPAQRAARQAHGDDGGAGLLELDRRRARARRASSWTSRAPGAGRRRAAGWPRRVHVAARSALQRRPRPFLVTSFSVWIDAPSRPASSVAALAPPPDEPPPEPPAPPEPPDPPAPAGAPEPPGPAAPGSNGEPPPVRRRPRRAARCTTSALRATAVRPSSSVARTPMLITVALGKLRVTSGEAPPSVS